jgi:formylglycine-generating enzyme
MKKLSACVALGISFLVDLGRVAENWSNSYYAQQGMVLIPGGTFWMGCKDATLSDALPVHRVTLNGFWLDKTEVTNEQFEHFVRQTGYITYAERQTIAGVEPGSLVFKQPSPTSSITNCCWWQYIPGASWRSPEGPGSNLEGRYKHPVVHVTWSDALAYTQWAGKRLPTEAEFEYAARGGLSRKLYSWGDELTPEGCWKANIWQGNFPRHNALEDGFFGTAPVGSYPPNGYGLYDMTGNVWEWCSDWYDARYYATLGICTVNPQGPATDYDPGEPRILKKVQRGGSFLCNARYCTKYLVGARGKGAIDTSTSHSGFRCARSCAPDA